MGKKGDGSEEKTSEFEALRESLKEHISLLLNSLTINLRNEITGLGDQVQLLSDVITKQNAEISSLRAEVREISGNKNRFECSNTNAQKTVIVSAKKGTDKIPLDIPSATGQQALPVRVTRQRMAQVDNSQPRTTSSGKDTSSAPGTSHAVPAPLAITTAVAANRPKVVLGTGPSTSLRAVERRRWLHVNRLEPGTTTENISSFIKDELKVPDITVQLLTSNDDYCSFKVGVRESMFDSVLDYTKWPAKVALREWEYVQRRRVPFRNQPAPTQPM